MKIVIKDKAKCFKVRCKLCGCVFTYELTDLGCKGTDGWETNCPVCEERCFHSNACPIYDEVTEDEDGNDGILH